MTTRQLRAEIEANLGPGSADVVLGTGEPTEQQLRAVGAQSREQARALLLHARRALRPAAWRSAGHLHGHPSWPGGTPAAARDGPPDLVAQRLARLA